MPPCGVRGLAATICSQWRSQVSLVNLKPFKPGFGHGLVKVIVRHLGWLMAAKASAFGLSLQGPHSPKSPSAPWTHAFFFLLLAWTQAPQAAPAGPVQALSSFPFLASFTLSSFPFLVPFSLSSFAFLASFSFSPFLVLPSLGFASSLSCFLFPQHELSK